jgi:hypothetical protein
VGVRVRTLSSRPLLVRHSAYAARCDAVELGVLLIRHPRRGHLDCGVIRLLAVEGATHEHGRDAISASRRGDGC